MESQRSKSGFFIGVTCPGCGSDLEMESDFFVLTCHSCGSVLRIKMPNIPPGYLIKAGKTGREIRFFADRYLKKASLPLTESGVEIKGIFQPYWKVDAILLKVRNRVQERHIYIEESGAEQDITYEQKLTDVSLAPYSMTISAGTDRTEIPHTIGMRPSYVRMEPYARENISDDFDCRSIVKPWEKVMADVERGSSRLNEIDPAAFGKNKTRLFRPAASIVYFPYYLIESESQWGRRRMVADGLSGNIVHYMNEAEYTDDFNDENSIPFEFGKLDIEFHRCPNCGNDLPGKPSYAYICDNCHQLVMLESHPLIRNQINVTVDGGDQNDRLFPFWLMRLPANEAGAVRMMFGGIHDSDLLILPAFRVANFEAMFKLSKRMSSAAPRLDYAPVNGFDCRFEPVTLGLSEAMVMAEVIIYRAKAGKTHGELSEGERFEPVDISLMYAPFHPQSYFYVDSIIGAVTFEKNLVG